MADNRFDNSAITDATSKELQIIKDHQNLLRQRREENDRKQKAKLRNRNQTVEKLREENALKANRELLERRFSRSPLKQNLGIVTSLLPPPPRKTEAELAEAALAEAALFANRRLDISKSEIGKDIPFDKSIYGDLGDGDEVPSPEFMANYRLDRNAYGDLGDGDEVPVIDRPSSLDNVRAKTKAALETIYLGDAAKQSPRQRDTEIEDMATDEFNLASTIAEAALKERAKDAAATLMAKVQLENQGPIAQHTARSASQKIQDEYAGWDAALKAKAEAAEAAEIQAARKKLFADRRLDISKAEIGKDIPFDKSIYGDLGDGDEVPSPEFMANYRLNRNAYGDLGDGDEVPVELVREADALQAAREKRGADYRLSLNDLTGGVYGDLGDGDEVPVEVRAAQLLNRSSPSTQKTSLFTTVDSAIANGAARANAGNGERALSGLLSSEILGQQSVSSGWDRFFKILSKMGARNDVSVVQDFIMGNMDVTADEAAVYANLVKQSNLAEDREIKRENLALSRQREERAIRDAAERQATNKQRLGLAAWPNTKVAIEQVQDAIEAGLESGDIASGETEWLKNFLNLDSNKKTALAMTDAVLTLLRKSAGDGTGMTIVQAANKVVDEKKKAMGSATDSQSPTLKDVGKWNIDGKVIDKR